MPRIEILMLCLAYALGRYPKMAEIRRAKNELLGVRRRSVHKVLKSIDYFLPYMNDEEVSLFKRQICTCMLSAINYRIALRVQDRTSSGYGICPRCGAPLDRDYQSYCDRCGQHLSWSRHAPLQDSTLPSELQWFSSLWQSTNTTSDGR